MMAEWDETLIAEHERYFHDCDNWECQAKQRAVRIARAEHNANLEARTLLAQRDGELEALRGALRGLYDSLPRYSCKSREPDGCPVCVARAALSDNQEGRDE